VGGSQVEEELDNHRHWQEAELPLLQRDRLRAAELEGEREELLEKLTAAQIGLAEMGETPPPPPRYCCPYPCPYCTLTHSLPSR
jgi:hypothetical protein